MKKHITKLLVLALSVLMLVSCMAGCGSGETAKPDANAPAAATSGGDSPAPAASGKVHKLTFSIGDPKTASKTKFYEDLAAKTLEATNGGLEITVHSGGTLFAHLEVCEGVLSGGADMGWFYTPWNADQYPLTEVIGLPLQFGNQLATTYAIRKAYENTPELREELSDFVVLNLYSGPMNYIYSSTPIRSPADLKGLQIRSFAGACTNLLADWGASALLIGATEIYDAMDKGTIQGAIYEWSGTKSNSLYDVIDYVTYVPLVSNPFLAIMNKDSYANIPEEYKAAFDEIWGADQTSFDFAEMFATEAEESRKAGVEEYKIEEIYPTDEELALFQPAADKYIADWIEKYTTDTFDAGQYFENVKQWYAEGCELYPDWNVGA